MIVEMSDPPKAFGVYPGGQSGNPGSRHYDELIDIWARGDYLSLELLKEPDPSTAYISQSLTPKK